MRCFGQTVSDLVSDRSRSLEYLGPFCGGCNGPGSSGNLRRRVGRPMTEVEEGVKRARERMLKIVVDDSEVVISDTVVGAVGNDK